MLIMWVKLVQSQMLVHVFATVYISLHTSMRKDGEQEDNLELCRLKIWWNGQDFTCKNTQSGCEPETVARCLSLSQKKHSTS